MAYADPQSVKIGTPTISLPRTGSTGNSGAFTAADRQTKLTISHQGGKRIRRIVRLDTNQIVSNPLVPSQNQTVSASAYLVLDQPLNGYSAQELVDVVTGLADWLKVTGNVTKFVGSEI